MAAQKELSLKALGMVRANSPAPDNPAQDLRPPIDEREAAVYIGMSVSYLRLSRMRGSTKCLSAPPFIRMGKKIRYLPSDLDAWMQARRYVPGEAA
jgi:predicted DNA-binding transcriptional regulator AlpA